MRKVNHPISVGQGCPQTTVQMIQAVSYLRASTSRQGISGLGLDAQKTSVQLYSKLYNVQIVREFTEIESGRKSNRPVLKQALSFCRKHKLMLVVAKIDRLARNVAFTSALMESDVSFICVDNPHATRLVLHIAAAFAEHEAELISERTKNSLREAVKRGVKLGTNGKKLSATNQRLRQEHVMKVKPVIDQLTARGIITVRALAEALNRRKIKTIRGKKWHPSTVQILLDRIRQLPAEGQAAGGDGS